MIKKLGFFSATMLVMGTVIGSGVFKKIIPMTSALGRADLVLWAWLAAGIVTCLGALTYAEITSRMPGTGGPYYYLREMYGPLWGFLYGWAAFSVIQTASISSIAYVFAESTGSLFQIQDLFVIKIIAASIVIFLTSANFFGVIVGGIIENFLTVIKIFGMLIIIYVAFSFSGGSIQNWTTAQALTPFNLRGWALIPAFFNAMLGAFWAFDGWINLGFIGGEIENPRRNIPLAIITGVGGVLLLYLAINLAYFFAIPAVDIADLKSQQGLVFAIHLMKQIQGPFGGVLMSILIMLSAFGSTNGTTLASSRIYYAMAKDGLFFKSVEKLHPKFHTPTWALILQCAWAVALIFWGSFDELTDLLIFVVFIFYGAGAIGLFQIRKTHKQTHKYLVPSVIPILYAIFCAVLVIITIYREPKNALVGAIIVGVGAPLYYFWQKPNKP